MYRIPRLIPCLDHRQHTLAVVVSGLAMMSASCANPLVGAWIAETPAPAGPNWVDIDLQLAADGSARVQFQGIGECNGSITINGAEWTSSGSSLTLGGSISCTGEVDCAQSGLLSPFVTCTNAVGTITGTYHYELMNNGYTLTLVGSSGGGSRLGSGTTYYGLASN